MLMGTRARSGRQSGHTQLPGGSAWRSTSACGGTGSASGIAPDGAPPLPGGCMARSRG
jgi:hypothetical protein